MAGHSKWANIRHRKERMDSKRGKIFSRLIKEIAVAAKTGGIDPAANPRLRLAVEKAREANVPNDNLERAIKRGGGQLEGADYAEIRHEGYGPGGGGYHCGLFNRQQKPHTVGGAARFHQTRRPIWAPTVRSPICFTVADKFYARPAIMKSD